MECRWSHLPYHLAAVATAGPVVGTYWRGPHDFYRLPLVQSITASLRPFGCVHGCSSNRQLRSQDSLLVRLLTRHIRHQRKVAFFEVSFRVVAFLRPAGELFEIHAEVFNIVQRQFVLQIPVLPPTASRLKRSPLKEWLPDQYSARPLASFNALRVSAVRRSFWIASLIGFWRSARARRLTAAVLAVSEAPRQPGRVIRGRHQRQLAPSTLHPSPHTVRPETRSGQPAFRRIPTRRTRHRIP